MNNTVAVLFYSFLCSLSPPLWYRFSLQRAQSFHGRSIPSPPGSHNHCSSQAIVPLFCQVIVLIIWDVVLLLLFCLVIASALGRHRSVSSNKLFHSESMRGSVLPPQKSCYYPPEGSARVEIDLKKCSQAQQEPMASWHHRHRRTSVSIQLGKAKKRKRGWHMIGCVSLTYRTIS